MDRRQPEQSMTDPEFRTEFHGHKDVLFRFAYRMTGSAASAEDMVQDCFLALWRNPAAYHPDRGTLRAFLLGVTRNLLLKRWRHERPFDALEDDEPLCPPADLEGRERSERVARAVQLLPPLQREAVILAEFEELPLEEIARVTGADLAAVKSRLHRARQNLRRSLAPLLETKGTPYGT
jgi:RNA polymerase sigma factor (sigma-70 family)